MRVEKSEKQQGTTGGEIDRPKLYPLRHLLSWTGRISATRDDPINPSKQRRTTRRSLKMHAPPKGRTANMTGGGTKDRDEW